MISAAALDLALVFLIVLGVLYFLGQRLFGKSSAPSCHSAPRAGSASCSSACGQGKSAAPLRAGPKAHKPRTFLA